MTKTQHNNYLIIMPTIPPPSKKEGGQYVPKHVEGKIYYEECDLCGHFHLEGYTHPNDEWDGEVDSTTAFTVDELDVRHGKNGWLPQCFADLEWVEWVND